MLRTNDAKPRATQNVVGCSQSADRPASTVHPITLTTHQHSTPAYHTAKLLFAASAYTIKAGCVQRSCPGLTLLLTGRSLRNNKLCMWKTRQSLCGPVTAYKPSARFAYVELGIG